MSEKKPREWAIDKIQCDPIDPSLPSWYCAYPTWTNDDEKNGRVRVREVLPDEQSEIKHTKAEKEKAFGCVCGKCHCGICGNPMNTTDEIDRMKAALKVAKESLECIFNRYEGNTKGQENCAKEAYKEIERIESNSKE